MEVMESEVGCRKAEIKCSKYAVVDESVIEMCAVGGWLVDWLTPRPNRYLRRIDPMPMGHCSCHGHHRSPDHVGRSSVLLALKEEC